LNTAIRILQISQQLAGKQLPHVLKQVLCNPKILKVGRFVTADLKYLQQACGSSSLFLGGIDLGKFAKDRLAVKSAKIGLADLCAEVVRKRLDKNVSERVSTFWEAETLTDRQIKYSACDVYAALSIYNALSAIPLPAPLASNPEPLSSVLLYNADNSRVIAWGVLSPDSTPSFDGIKITATRCLVEIQDVYVPGAIITTHKQQPLAQFGQTPFSAVCLRTHLRMASSQFPPSNSTPEACSSQDPMRESILDTSPKSLLNQPSDSDIPAIDPQPSGASSIDQPANATISSLMLDTVTIGDRPALTSFEVDLASQQTGEQILGEVGTHPN
jgi:3'-5' exonuclease